MKRILQSISFFVIGTLMISSCTEEKTGKSPEKIIRKMDVDPEEVVQDSIPLDSMTQDEAIIIPPPAPRPVLPDPWPSPEPDPMPYPPDSDPIPEPEPYPMPVQVDPVLDFAEIDAVYPGGLQAMKEFLSDNIKYPEIAREMNEQGRVYVQFVVERDGSLSDIEVMRGVSQTIDREAIRVMRLMPKWKPAESGGKIVRCRSRLPINFTLD